MTPFYKIFIGGVDLTEYVERFTFEDSIEEAALLTLNVKMGHRDVAAGKDTPFGVNNKIEFHYGYIGGIHSAARVAVIKSAPYLYSDGVVLITVQATALSVTMKTGIAQAMKVWKGLTTAEIVSEIASRYGLSAEIVGGSRTWPSLPQAGRSDWVMLRYLATTEPAGNSIVYVRDSTIYFGPRKDTEKASALEFYYGEDDRIVSFEPRWEELTVDAKTNKPKKFSGQVEDPNYRGWNEEAKYPVLDYQIRPEPGVKPGDPGYFKIVKLQLTPEQERQKADYENWRYDIEHDPSLQGTPLTRLDNLKTVQSYQAMRDRTKQAVTNVPDLPKDIFVDKTLQAYEDRLSSGADQDFDWDDLGETAIDSEVSYKRYKVMKGTLMLKGAPDIEPNVMAKMLNVSAFHRGDWWLTKITHNLGGGQAYQTAVEMKKDKSMVYIGDITSTDPTNTRKKEERTGLFPKWLNKKDAINAPSPLALGLKAYKPPIKR